MSYVAHIIIILSIYIVLTSSLDLLAGHMGLLHFAHATFFGIGAYSSALLSTGMHTGFLFGMAAGVILAALASQVLALATLRLRDDYLAIFSFGMQMVFVNVCTNWTSVTRGALGVPGVPRPVIGRLAFGTPLRLAMLSLLFASCSYFIIMRLAASPFGRVLRAIRENEELAQSLGKNTAGAKVIACAVSAALAAAAGSLYAHYLTFIDPGSFGVMDSILLVEMVILGGAGGRWGPIVGASAFVLIPEALRFVGIASSSDANVRQIIFAASIVLITIYRPRGLLGRYGFGR